MLEFKAFKAAANKVKLLAFHPTQPWLAYSDKGQTVAVLDWTTQQVIYEAQLGSVEDAHAQDAALRRLAEKDPAFYGPPLSSSASPARPTAPGAVKDLCFMDMDTGFWQIAQLHAWQHRTHSSTSIPQLGRARKLKSHRWLVLACETKILLQDLTSSATIDIPRTVLDSKVPTCVAVLYMNGAALLSGAGSGEEDTKEACSVSPVIAAGTAGGGIYLLSISRSYCYARLVGGHKLGVTKLLVIGGKDTTSPDRLVSAGADGTVALWDPSAAARGAAAKEVSPVSTAKVHDSEILSLALCCAPTAGAEPGPVMLATSGEDKRVALLDVPSLSRQIARWKPLAKGSVDGLAVSPRAGAASGSESPLLATSGDRAAVWSLSVDARQHEADLLLSLDPFLPAGTKKAAKVYTVACHPLQPHIVAVGANAGIGLLSFDGRTAVPAAVLPATQPAASDLDNLATTGGQGLEFLFATENALWRFAYRAGWNLDNQGRVLNAELRSKASINSNLGAKGIAQIAASADGRHCSLVWPATTEFAIYTSAGGSEWRQVHSGSGSSVAWAPNASLFAVLHQPQVKLPEVRRGKSKKSKAKEEEAAAQAAAYAASVAAQEGGHVKIYSISSAGSVAEQPSAKVNADRPGRLHGGPVLGITSNKTISRGQKRGHGLQFVSWQTGRPVGPDLLAPAWLAWNPDVTAVALAYPAAIVICRVQPVFAPIATLPIQAATSGIWQERLLVVASATEMHGVFVAAGPDTKAPFVQSVKLASLEGGIVAQMAAAGDRTASLPAEGMRCAGAVAIGGIRDGVLWLIDARGQPFMIPLSHAGLRARLAAAQGDAAAARATAERAGLPKQNHDELAAFIAAIAPQNGLEEALSLSGISLRTELALSRRATKLRRALRCLQALAAGADDAAAFREFPAWAEHLSETAPLERGPVVRPSLLPPIHQLIQHTRARSLEVPDKPDPRRSVLAFIAADNAEEESSEDEEAEEPAGAMMDLAQAPGEAIDWDALLAATEPSTSERSPGQQTVEGAEANGDGRHPQDAEAALGLTVETPEPGAAPKAEPDISKEESQRVAELIDEGLLLVDAALGAGHEDVAIAALRTLLRGAASLQPERLQAILVRCGQCNMTAEIRSFASKIITDGTGASPETAALAAAMVDDASLARSALQSSGMIALSAIFSHTWKSGNSLQIISDWGTFLTAAAGNGVTFVAAPPL